MSNIIGPQAGPQTVFANLMDDMPLVFYGGAAKISTTGRVKPL